MGVRALKLGQESYRGCACGQNVLNVWSDTKKRFPLNFLFAANFGPKMGEVCFGARKIQKYAGASPNDYFKGSGALSPW